MFRKLIIHNPPKADARKRPAVSRGKQTHSIQLHAYNVNYQEYSFADLTRQSQIALLAMSIQIMLVVVTKGLKMSLGSEISCNLQFTSSEYKSSLEGLSHRVEIFCLVGLSMWVIIPTKCSNYWQTANIGLWSEKLDTQSKADTSGTALAILLETNTWSIHAWLKP